MQIWWNECPHGQRHSNNENEQPALQQTWRSAQEEYKTDDAGEVAGKTRDDVLTAAGGIAGTSSEIYKTAVRADLVVERETWNWKYLAAGERFQKS